MLKILCHSDNNNILDLKRASLNLKKHTTRLLMFGLQYYSSVITCWYRVLIYDVIRDVTINFKGVENCGTI
jgi:hypothetical protein